MTIEAIDTVQISIDLFIFLVAIASATYGFITVKKQSGFGWVMFLISICVVLDVSATVIYILSYLMNSELFVSSNSDSVIAAGMAVSAFLFYFCNNLLYWLYSLKQWTISIEVPRQISKLTEEDPGITVSQNCYKSLKWIGILANASVSILIAIYRY